MKIKFTLIALVILNIAFAQNFKFGKVSKEELQEKFNPQDSSASACYLYKFRKTEYVYKDKVFVVQTIIHERLKIYNKEGFDYATKSINLYKNNSNKETVNGLKAYTYNIIEGKIEETKLRNDGIFDSELQMSLNQKKFTMPNIKEGCIIEYRYTIESPFSQNIDEFVFQHDIPIKKLEAKFEVPEYYNFKSKTKGYLKINRSETSKNEMITVKSKSHQLQGGVIEKYENDLEYKVNIESYSMTNIPALNEEPYVNSINNYRSSLKHELSYTKFPNSQLKYYSTTWDDVVKTIYENSSFGNELKKTNYFEDDINAIINGVTEPMKKANLIFNFLKSKVKWNEYYGKYTNKGVKKAYKNQTGNVAEINLMLTAMLRYAGLNANPVLVSTRENGFPLFPTREGYNYIVSVLELENDVVLFDATSKFSSPNVLPYRALNWEGRIIRENGSTALVNLYPKKIAKNTMFLNINLDEDGVTNGLIRNVYTNHKGLNFRESYITKNKDEYNRNLENKLGGIKITDFEVKNELELAKPITSTFKFTAEDQYETIDDKIYINPLFFFTTKENPFKLDEREFPVDFGYPSKTTYRVNIKLPSDYIVEFLPEPISIKLPDGLGAFSYNLSSTNNGIQLVTIQSINTPIVASLYYKSLKEYFKQIVNKENEIIILVKQ